MYFPGLAIATVLPLLAIILQDTKGLFRGSKQDSKFLLIETDDEKIQTNDENNETDDEKIETDDEKNENDDEKTEEEAGEDYNDSEESGDKGYGSECSISSLYTLLVVLLTTEDVHRTPPPGSM